MLFTNSKNTVFSRYNTAVVAVFVIIVLAAFSVASYRYFSELSVYQQRELSDLEAQATQLNSMLEQSVQAITGMQDFANYSLAYPEELTAGVPKLAQEEGQQFYLDLPRHDVIGQRKRFSGNITGKGDVSNFTLEQKQELAMANALNPAFISAEMSIPEATWFYYVSLNKFVNIYPWIGRNNWRYSDRMIDNVYINSIKKSAKNRKEFYWSPPYLDTAGKGMNSSLAAGVHRNEYLVGVVVIDINLFNLHKSLVELTKEDHGLVLLNKENRVLVFKSFEENKLTLDTTWQDVMPEPIKQLSVSAFTEIPRSEKIDDWLIQKHVLPINGWTLLKYQPYQDFTAPLFSRFMFMFATLFIGLVAFFSLVYTMTRSTFIKPAEEFITHIENCAKGDPGKIKPTPDWLPWFKVVEDIFGQNRTLLQQLKEQNTALDIRVHEKTQALLESSEKHQRDYVLLRSVINAIPELIIFNDPEGELIGCNKAFEQFIGKNKKQILGHSAVHLLPKPLSRVMTEFLLLDNDQHSYQRVVETNDHIFEVFSTHFLNDAADVLGTITIFRDVTSQHSIQTALENAKFQAEYANQAKSQFLANMSHEIRTPINAMQGMMDLLNNTLLSSHQLHYLENAQSASTSLIHLIDELLDLSKIEAGKMIITKEQVYLDDVIDRALKLNCGIAHAKGLNIIVDVGVEVPYWVLTDSVRLVQVLSNLLNNAIKFTHQGEIKLLIETTAVSDNNALIRFEVTDTGIGIAQDKQHQLFDAFSQADESMTRKFGGSGLGLSISQKIVNLLGGEISLQSELAKGSQFSFVLPVSSMENLNKNQANKKVIICALAQALPASLVLAIEKEGWQYQQFDTIEELVNANLKEPIILLVTDEFLSNDNNIEQLSDELRNQILQIGLCQPTMTKISAQTSAYFDQINIPYLLLDMPLYRYSLSQISKVIDSKHPTEDKVNVELTESISHKNLLDITVLLVEDNLVNQLVAKELLLNMQANVVIAENGQVALELIESQVFDVVLMDIQMPVMDGLTATLKLREKFSSKDLPIIAMTAHARDEDKHKSLTAGMNLHIAKPVSAKLLLSSILSVLPKIY